MKEFRADLHIHSRYSRATSKKLGARLLAAWARVKGLDVLGTGDFTHPAWMEELKENLVPDPRSGLYELKDPGRLERELDGLSVGELSGRTLFMLQTEISSIYKRGGKVRKVHNLVYMPDFEAAEKFTLKLGKVGNLASDGRPILGLDSRDLLEMVLETDPLAYLVPAHIWTPWFSALGSKSGFDSIEECYGPLTSEIFALETGLSSDPEMNWLLSGLDRYRLISNSDAHSGEKLGREANLFTGDRSYEGIYRALRGEALGHKFMGTIEFFPEEGKYHLDGHRKCGVVMEPRETMARGGLCPVCGKPMTVGVLNRVLALADREEPVQPSSQPGYVSLIPLCEILSEIVGTGPNTKKVKAQYARCIQRFGSELGLLRDAPLEDVGKMSTLLAEGISRMRRGEVLREPGYDGSYGVISVFSPKERREFSQGKTLAGLGGKMDKIAVKAVSKPAGPGSSLESKSRDNTAGQAEEPVLNPDQQRAAGIDPGPVLVLAGPGTGKTHTLMSRAESLLAKGENPRRILAVTFTRKAAHELEERLVARFGENSSIPRADTLHGLAFEYWTKAYDDPPVILSEEGAVNVFMEANQGHLKGPEARMTPKQLKKIYQQISVSRERMQKPAGNELEYHRYVKLKESWNLTDYTDLLEFWLEQIKAGIYLCPYTQILVDEVQDLSELQLAVIRGLAPESGAGLFAIGDPRQSIYSFRGGVTEVRERLQEFWPNLELVELKKNYRSSQAILDLAGTLFPEGGPLEAVQDSSAHIRLFEGPSDESEASWIGDRIRRLLGGTSHSLEDSRDEDKELAELQGEFSPGDLAVLVRFKGLIPPIMRTLSRLGLPCSAPESEAFWVEPRAAKILRAAGSFLGVSLDRTAEEDDGGELSCPDSVLARGPLGVEAYLQDIPPFDRLFWQSRPFKQLVKAYDLHGGWAGLLNWINLQSEIEMVSRKSEKVQIMTLHAAKGLEFEVVFMPALEDGLMPFAGPSLLSGKPGENDRPDEEEEKRLFYVGLTRARQGLFLSRAAKRFIFGREIRLPQSRFLKTLSEKGGENLKRIALKTRTRRKEERLTLI